MRRPRLTTLLDDTTSQCIILQAPAGYGKTSLACEWLEGREDVAWFTARQDSADVAAFSVGIAEAMTHILPDAPNRVRERVLVAEPREEAARPLAEVLAADLADWPEDAILVVDDYHLAMASSATELFVDWLLMRCPQLRMLVTTRRRPGWATARRTLNEEVAIVGQDSLALRPSESAVLLAMLGADQTQSILRQAEGWPALVGLAALLTEHHRDGERVPDEAYRYLAEEVFRAQPEELQTVMLAASVPRTVSSAFLERQIPADAIAECLDNLLRDGLLRRAAAGGFEFHPLLRTVLRDHLRRHDRRRFDALLNESIDHASRLAAWDEALEAANELGPAHLTDTLLIASESLLGQGRLESLAHWSNQVDHLTFAPALSVIRAEVALREGRIQRAKHLAHASLASPTLATGVKCRALLTAARAALHSGEDIEAFDLACRAITMTAEPSRLVELSLIIVLAGAQDPSCQQCIEEAISRLKALSHTSAEAELRTVSATLGYRELQGDIRDVYPLVGSAWPAVEAARDPYAKSAFLYVAAWLAQARGDYDDSLRIAELALTEARALRLKFAYGHLELIAVTSLIGAGRLREACARLDALDLTATEDPRVRAEAHGTRMLLLAIAGDAPAALLLADPPDSTSAPASTRGTIVAIRGFVLAVAGMRADAAEQVARARALTTSAEALAWTHATDAFMALTHPSGRSSRRKARAAADAAVATGVPGVLTLASRASSALAAFVDTPTSKRLDQHGRPSRQRRRRAVESTGNLLTPREYEVLALIGRGYTNAEIARHLVIEVSTAKEHVHRVLSKLGVPSRVHAAVMAPDILARSTPSPILDDPP